MLIKQIQSSFILVLCVDNFKKIHFSCSHKVKVGNKLTLNIKCEGNGHFEFCEK